MIPTAGRIVYFKGQKDGSPKNYPAIVIDVDTQEEGVTKLLLGLFSDVGLQTIWVDRQGEDAGAWDWMPYQKDQQARIAKDEASA